MVEREKREDSEREQREDRDSLSRARLSRTKERVWSNCILRFVQACQEILGVLIGLSTAVTFCGFPPRARESGARARVLNSSLNLQRDQPDA